MSFADDLDDDLDTMRADFGVDAVYDGATTISVLFSAEYVDALDVASSGPAADVKASDVAADPRGKTLAIAGTTYKIRNVVPSDDARMLTLKLEKQ